jgi:hypothetical protein
MKKRLAIIGTITALTLSFLSAALLPVTQVFANCDDPTSITNGMECAKNDDQVDKLVGGDGAVNVIISTLLFAIGILSVVMLIYGGIKYSISAGDAAKVTSAKNTIMYAVVGLVVALAAYAIINFVVSAF